MNEKYISNDELIDKGEEKEDFPEWETNYVEEDIGTKSRDIIPNVGVPYSNLSATIAETYPYFMICHFEMEYKDLNGLFGGTGAFIGPNAILTAAHNIYNKIGNTEYKIKRMKVTPCGGLSNKYGSLMVDFRDGKNRYFYRPEWQNDVNSKNRTYDYALITIPVNFDVSGSNYFRVGELNNLRTHLRLLAARKLGNGTNQFVESGTDNDPVKDKNLKQYGNTKGTFIHYFNTEDQFSGAPLFVNNSDNTYNIFGIHSAGVGSRLNLASQITNDTIVDIGKMLGK